MSLRFNQEICLPMHLLGFYQWTFGQQYIDSNFYAMTDIDKEKRDSNPEFNSYWNRGFHLNPWSVKLNQISKNAY